MKQLYLLFLIVGNVSLSIAQNVNVYERSMQHEPSHDFDVLHYKIALKFEGANRAFQGETTVTLRSLSDHFDDFTLDAETYQVNSVKTTDYQSIPFRHENGKLHIQLHKTFGYSDTLSVIIGYGTTKFQVNPEDFGMGANYPLGIGF
ncbi:MAG: hypothetical protein IPJ74_23230 [Saprospiraceae bacterium]|nr:hypothetical protein [Saprospiraceae bacterium]